MRRKKRAPARSRRPRVFWVLVLLSMVSGALFCLGFDEWLDGVYRFLVYLNPITLKGPEDLPVRGQQRGALYSVKGIPDYAHILRQMHTGQELHCFRIVGFKSELVVCARQFEVPDSIQEILTPRVFTGTLASLNSGNLQETVRNGFRSYHNIDFPQSAYLLIQDSDATPSLKVFVLVSSLGVLCILSLCGIILYR